MIIDKLGERNLFKKAMNIFFMIVFKQMFCLSAFALLRTLSLIFDLKVFMEENASIYLPAVLPSVSAAHGYTQIIFPLYDFE